MDTLEINVSHANTNRKKAGVALFMRHTELRAEPIRVQRILRKDKNRTALWGKHKTTSSKKPNQKLTELKVERDKSIVKVGQFNRPLSVINKTREQKNQV